MITIPQMLIGVLLSFKFKHHLNPLFVSNIFVTCEISPNLLVQTKSRKNLDHTSKIKRYSPYLPDPLHIPLDDATIFIQIKMIDSSLERAFNLHSPILYN
jgi:hypothetical protein